MNARPASPHDTLTAFRLGDQFSREHTRDDYLGRTLLLVAGDRAGSLHVPAWIAALDAGVRDASVIAHERAAKGRLVVLGVADLRGVPALLRPMVRALLPRDDRRIVLLDWDGVIGTAHEVARGRCTALVVNATGDLVARAAGAAPEAADIARLAAAVVALLMTGDEPPASSA